MQDLNSFTLPILGFEGDVSIPIIPVSTRDPGVESSHGPSTGSDAITSRTRASKRKAPIDPRHQKKAKKGPGKPLGRIKISNPKPKAPTSTPIGDSEGHPDPPIKKVRLSVVFSFIVCLLICKLPCRVPQDIHLASHTMNLLPESESPKVDKPLSPSTGKTSPEMSKPPGPKDTNARLVPQVIRLPHLPPTQNVMPLTNPQGQIPPSIKKHPHRILSLLDSRLMVDHDLVKVHLCQGLRSNHDNTQMLQSPCGTIWTS
jgi:hypothetical protein